MESAGKVILTIIIIAAILFGLVALLKVSNNVGPTIADTHEEYSGVIPHMEKVAHNREDGYWSYYVDHTTNNVYLVYRCGYQFGMSTILNPDGTTMTLEQLINTR